MEPISNTLDNLIRMPIDGWKKKDSAMIGKSNQSHLQNQPNRKDHRRSMSEQSKLQCEDMNQPCKQEKPLSEATLSEDMEGSKKLTTWIVQCFNILDTFGKPPEALDGIVGAFQMILRDYTASQIDQAFEQYMRTQTVMPKPANIVQIIDPPKQEKQWCKVTFLDIRRKMRENVFITDEEKKYCDDFVNAEVKSSSDDRVLLSSAVTQARLQDKKYWE